MMLHFPDSETGYYDTEEAFYALDAEQEAVEERRYLAEIEASQGCEFDARPIVPYIDPETGCTAEEMSEDRAPAYPMEREIAATQTEGAGVEGKVA